MNELIRIEQLWKVFGGRRDADPETHLQDPLARVAVRDVSLTIGEGEIFVVMGLSGSGKSSLAFDTIYAEGQRRYVESLSAYARQFLELMEKPDVDSIEGLSPAISIEHFHGGG